MLLALALVLVAGGGLNMVLADLAGKPAIIGTCWFGVVVVGGLLLLVDLIVDKLRT